jgi:DNA-binding transcriptional MerR regulator
MLTIGDFARHGRVSIRMLRHYDAIGLLRPAQVDQSSGYRPASC